MHFWDHGLVPSLLFAAINTVLLEVREALPCVGRDLKLSFSVVLVLAFYLCLRVLIRSVIRF